MTLSNRAREVHSLRPERKASFENLSQETRRLVRWICGWNKDRNKPKLEPYQTGSNHKPDIVMMSRNCEEAEKASWWRGERTESSSCLAWDLTKRTYPYQELGAKHSRRDDSNYRGPEAEHTCREEAGKDGERAQGGWCQVTAEGAAKLSRAGEPWWEVWIPLLGSPAQLCSASLWSCSRWLPWMESHLL